MLEARLRLRLRNSSTSTVPPSPGLCQSVVCWSEKPEGTRKKIMNHILSGLKIIGPFALLLAGFSSCASTDVQKSSAEKEREAWYSNYVDNTEKEWSTHF